MYARRTTPCPPVAMMMSHLVIRASEKPLLIFPL